MIELEAAQLDCVAEPHLFSFNLVTDGVRAADGNRLRCQLQLIYQSSRQHELPVNVPGIDVRFQLEIADAYFDYRNHVRILERQNVRAICRRQRSAREPELFAGIIER